MNGRSVKELVEKGNQRHVPPLYVRQAIPLSRPLPPGWEIPLIDISALRGPRRMHIVSQIGHACREWGFFTVINHGLLKNLIDSMWEAYHDLFALPSTERAKFEAGLSFPAGLADRITQNKQKLANFATWRDTMRFLDFDPDQSDALSHTPQFFREPACTYFKAVRNLGFDLLEAISESLGLEPQCLADVTGRNGTMNVSMLYYSPCPDPNVTLGMLPHKDMSSLTLVLEDLTGGLQVFKEGYWVDAKPVPESFVVNTGEVVEILTNKTYKSVLHRVMNNKDKLRTSISCFLFPAYKSKIGPLQSFVSEENPAYFAMDDFETHHYNHYLKIAE